MFCLTIRLSAPFHFAVVEVYLVSEVCLTRFFIINIMFLAVGNKAQKDFKALFMYGGI